MFDTTPLLPRRARPVLDGDRLLHDAAPFLILMVLALDAGAIRFYR
jgi:hypothetical protein